MLARCLLMSPIACSSNTSTEAAKPGAVDTYCLVTHPLPNSHSCPTEVQTSIDQANAQFFDLCQTAD